MFISVDVKCPSCEAVEPRFVKKDQLEEQTCTVCFIERAVDVKMTVLPSATRTTFRYADERLK